MERRSGSTVSWAVVGVSALALAMVVLSFPSVQDSVHPFLSIIALASTIAFVVGVIGIFHFSRSGWDVEGSTLEWIIAAIVSPALPCSCISWGGRAGALSTRISTGIRAIDELSAIRDRSAHGR